MKKNEKNINDFDDINPYEVDKLSKIPSWLIILFLKFWAAAAAVFFMLIGGIDIGLDFSNNNGVENDPVQVLATNIVVIVLIGLGLTLVMHIIVRSFVLLMHNRRNNTFRYNMVNYKGTKSLFIDLAYNMFMSIVLYYVTLILSYYHLVLDLFNTTGGIGIDPITYGLSYIVVDAIFVSIKNLVYQFYERAKYNKQIQGE